LPVGSFMRKDVAYLRENMWVDAALSFLSERGLRDAPVLDEEGRPVGVLYVDDVESEDSFDDGERAGEEAESSVAELKRAGKSSNEASDVLQAEFRAKYPDWAQPVRIVAAVNAIYAETP